MTGLASPRLSRFDKSTASIITVIIPVYKVEPYLRRCVNSILAQTFQDFEVILVDDGSPDNCGVICDEYAAKDARVHVIHQANGGLSAARNAGIDWAFANSQSEWLTFVDSDDWVHPQYLEYLFGSANENKVSVSICDFQYVYSDDPAPLTLCDEEILSWETMLLDHYLPGVISCAKLFAKELFQDLRFPLGKIHEDEFLTYKLLFLAQDVVYLPIALYNYYQNPESITKRSISVKRLDAVEALEERIIFTHQHGSMRLFRNDLFTFLDYCIRIYDDLQSATHIDASIRKQKSRFIRKRVQRVLLQYGHGNLSLRKHQKYYCFAFPHSIGLIKKGVLFWRRISRRQNHAPN